MLVGGDLGLWRPVLVVVVGVVFLVFRRQWRLSSARKKEISRLLVLASEESARAELESTAWYGKEAAAVPASGLQQLKHQCAVCFCPTTTRCSQCKAVRYCSGKCQIIHWRQGHKQECRPLETFDQSNEGGGSSQKVFNQEEYEYCGGGDTHSGSSSSSGWSVEGSSDSLSESSMPSPGFWDGYIDTRRFGIDTCDDFAQSSPVDSGGDKMSEELCKEDPRSMISSSLKYREINSSSLNAYCVRPDASDVGPRITKDAKINSSAPSLRPEKPENVAANTSSFSHALGTEGFGSQLGRVSDANLASGSGRDSGQTEKPSKVVGGIHALSPEKSNYVAPMDTRSFSYASRTQEFGSRLSKRSDANLRSGSQRESGQNEKPSKVDGIHALSPEKSNNVAPTNRSSFSYALRTQDFGPPFGKGSNENLTSSSGRDFDQTENCTQVDGIHGISSRSQNSRNGLKTSMLKVVDQLKPSKLSRQYYPSGAGRETPGRYSVKGLFPHELFVKLYNWNKAELHPCGLINCGNSCYANAVLQCLVFTPPLTAYFLQGLHSKACEKKDWCFTCEFESLILKAKESNSPVSPIRILSQIENIGSQLGYGRQEDAHEFLRYAIDTMQSICLKEVGVETLASSDEEKTIVGLTFGGYLRSKIKCMNCGGKSERHERMMDLTVEIDGNICTLEAALRQFTGTEILDGENKYKCSRCKSYEKAKKKLTIVEAPNVLTIALKRFQSGKFGKLSKPVKFPEVLDMTPYMMNGTSDKSPIYRLYGVVVHLDIMNASFSGHYVCYVKNIQNKWFKIDDSSVKAIELVTELTKGAYMLFYARCSPRPQKVLKSTPRKPKNPSLKSKSHSTFDYDAGPRTDRSKTGLYPNRPSYFQRIPSNFEEDLTSSDYSSSSFFSEPGSCSPESSTKDSISADDYFDQIFGDLGHNWNSPWRNSSDSDTSSLSPSPSPEGYSGHSTFLCSDISEGNKENGTFLCSDMNSEFRKLDSSSNCRVSDSCRETNLDRLGRLDNVKSGIHLRRSLRGRTE